MKKQLKNWSSKGIISLLSIVLLYSIASAQQNNQNDISNAKTTARDLYQNTLQGSITSESGVKQNLTNPVTTDNDLYSFDKTNHGGAKITCLSSDQFLQVLVQPGGEGDLTLVKVFLDTDMDGNLSQVFEIPSGNTPNTPSHVSGVCANGVIACDSGTWNNCKYYKWVSSPPGDPNLSIGLVEVNITDLGGCYCINSSCGSNLVWNNLSIILRDLGGGIAGAIQANHPEYAISDVKINGPVITYQAQNSKDCGGSLNTGSLPTHYLNNAAAMEGDAQAEASTNDYYQMLQGSQAFQDMQVDIVNCQIKRTVTQSCGPASCNGNGTLNTNADRCEVYAPKSTSMATHCGGWDHVLGIQTRGGQIRVFAFDPFSYDDDSGWWHSSCSESFTCYNGNTCCASEWIDLRGSGTTVITSTERRAAADYKIGVEVQNGQIRILPLNLNDYTNYGDWVDLNGTGISQSTLVAQWCDNDCLFRGEEGCCTTYTPYTVKIQVGDHRIRVFCNNYHGDWIPGPCPDGYTTDDDYCIDDPVCPDGTTYDTSVNMCTSNIQEVINNQCEDYENREDCYLKEETVDGIETFKNYNPTGLTPVTQICETTCDGTQICRDWWEKKRTYVCATNNAYDFSNAKERMTYLKDSFSSGNNNSFSYEDKRLSDNGWVFESGGSEVMSVDNYGECEYVCKLRREKTDTQATTSGNVTQQRGTSTSSYEIVYKSCQLDSNGGPTICPQEGNEEIIKDCQCIDEFAEAATIMATLHSMKGDMVCATQ